MSTLLVVNVGSSSVKLRALDEATDVRWSRDLPALGPDELRAAIGDALAAVPGVTAVGHRVVHGGAAFAAPVAVDDDVLRALREVAELAPLHDPPAIAAIEAQLAVAPALTAVACFDTAFHATLPEAARTYALPAAWRERRPLRRFGFHGLSHAYASRRTAQLLRRPVESLRIVTAHLGAGASLAAVAAGRSVDTTMGFTPLEGLAMQRRSGSVDPGLILWMQREDGLAAAEVERALSTESGLRGLSGTSGDMREVLAGVDAGDDACRLALDVYVHRLAGGVAAMAAAMGGIDALAFTGGVGEHAAPVRELAVARLGFLGLELDPVRNERAMPDATVSPSGAGAAVVVVGAREDAEIARQVRALLDR